MRSLTEIHKEVSQRAVLIGAPAKFLPTYGQTEDGARPHVEVDLQSYHYVVVERGEEVKRVTTQNFDELLYHIFKSATFSMACDYELMNRIENQDHRRLLFRQHIELLSAVSKAWAERKSKEYEKIILQYPFDDEAGIRTQLSKKVGWKKAFETYPMPSSRKISDTNLDGKEMNTYTEDEEKRQSI